MWSLAQIKSEVSEITETGSKLTFESCSLRLSTSCCLLLFTSFSSSLSSFWCSRSVVILSFCSIRNSDLKTKLVSNQKASKRNFTWYSLQTFESITCPFCIHLVCMALVSTFDSKFEKSFDDFSRLSQIFDRHIFARCRIRTFVQSCRFLLIFCDSRRDLLYLLVISIYKLNEELVWDPIMTSVF